MGIVGADAQQDQKALADLTVDLAVNGDGCVSHAGNNCAHIETPLTFAAGEYFNHFRRDMCVAKIH